MANTIRAFTRTYTFSAKEVLYVVLEILKYKLNVPDITQLYKLKAIIFTVVPCILILSNSFIYQLMHNRVGLKEY